ncbi:putative intron-encoded endonuclease bI1 (mitochondrion) [Beauveria bassiana D1-5]|uniref:Putative intron-encoded endonuclease bI1 n=1 Tax=Beauveria bassiana D1-5 TaxID=1245745 RepID=A0A0A2V815_BEABA|nr:putative intron-encoded endonuclease bI1 [Beauveria bassiana D1-5]
MRILKSHPLLKLLNAYIIDHSQPTNISYLWNFGSLLGLCLGIQIITGVTLAMHYNPSVAEAFNSVEHIMRDVNNGWLIRYLHSNTASAFFFLVYLHIGRGFYYGSYRSPRTLAWILGVIILILMMGIGFLGYFNIAQNDYNIYNKTTAKLKMHNNRRYYSTSAIYSLRTDKKNKASDRIKNFLHYKNLKPVFIYDNINEDSVRKNIAKETKGLSGIYMILNKETLSYYIGSASTDRINSRFTNHLIYFNGSKIVKNSVKKYGLHNFVFIVLELFPKIVNQENNKELFNLEDFYLKSLLPDYNILTEAGSSFGYKHTEITRIKMKTNYSEKRRQKISALNKGKSFSPETIESMRQSALNKNNINYTEQGILNMKKRSKAIIVKELNNIVYGEFNSIVDTARALNCSTKTIQRTLKTPSRILKGRWILNYVASS